MSETLFSSSRVDLIRIAAQWRWLSACGCLLLALTVCWATAALAGQRPVLRVGLYENRPKIFFGEDGRAGGFWPELFDHIAAKENWELRYVPGTWNQGLTRLRQGQIDIMPDVAFTAERARNFRFTKVPVLVSWSRIYIRSDNAAIQSVTDLKDKRIAVLAGSVNFTGAGGLQEIVRGFNLPCSFLPFDDYARVFSAVADGEADAGVANRDFGNLNQKKYHLKKTAVVFQPVNIQFALSRQNPMAEVLARRIDVHMKALAGDNDSVYYRLLASYFESEIAEKTVEVFPKSTQLMLQGAGVLLLVLILVVLFGRMQVKRKTREIGEKNEALRAREAHLRTLIETIPDLIWLKDPQGVYLACNPKFERFFGALERDIVGRTDYDFLAKDLADFFRSRDKAAMAANGPVMNEEEITYADDGHRELLETVKTPMYDAQGALVGVLGIGRDISERKRIEAERQKLTDRLRQTHKMEAIGTLAGGIAHDFNNILSSIIGYSELAGMELTGDGSRETAKAYIEQVVRGALQASDLVHQILTFSRKSAHKKQALALRQVVKDAMKFLRASIPSSIEILEHIDSDATILADPGKIHQVVMNLCTNAYQAMMETGGLLSVSLTEVMLAHEDCLPGLGITPGRYVQLNVSDTGHGMNAATKEKIFEPYFTTKAPDKGTGLGLSVVFGIVKEHNGHINVYSEPGQGASFHIYFPVIDQAPDPFVSKASQASLPGTETILMVDDEAHVLESAKKLLEGLGYTVVAATDGKTALMRYQESPDRFDLVITDMTMPGINGLELSKTILTAHPGKPIILCTGHNELVNREKAKAAGIMAYYEKPIMISALSQVIRSVLEGRGPASVKP